MFTLGSRGGSLGARIIIIVAFLAFSAQGASAADPKAAVVVIIATFQDGSKELGTGAFVDHDGLVLTADHVIHGSTKSPSSGAHPETMLVDQVLPTQANPVTIEVYNPLLGKKIVVDPTVSGAVVGGALSPSSWIDAAFIRVPLTDTQRAVIQPLDLALSPPAQNETLTAWGPEYDEVQCNDLDDSRCLSPQAISETLGSDPAITRDYQVSVNMRVGYSGGPLVNSSSNIVGIGSWGVRVNGSATQGPQLAQETYLPSTYIVASFIKSNFLNSKQSPEPAWLSGPLGCTNTKSLPFLTVFDMAELFPQTSQQSATAEQCQCCCQSLRRAPASLNLPAANLKCATPITPACMVPPLLTIANSIQVAAATGELDAATIAQYAALRKGVKEMDSGSLSTEDQKALYNSLATTSAILAANHTSASQFPTATSDALFASSQLLSTAIAPEIDLSYVYQRVSKLNILEGDQAAALAANMISDFVRSPVAVQDSLHLNTENLQKIALRNVPSTLQ